MDYEEMIKQENDEITKTRNYKKADRFLPKRWRFHFLFSTGYALRKIKQETNN